jgi:hypothetical protein
VEDKRRFPVVPLDVVEKAIPQEINVSLNGFKGYLQFLCKRAAVARPA